MPESNTDTITTAQPAGIRNLMRRLFSNPSKQSTDINTQQMFSVTDEQRRNMAEDVQRLVQSGKTGEPSTEQWTMIFCEHPVTRVIAAAGSGKSSTLLLRLLFMLKYLKIAPETLTVFSFTSASCQELRRKLVDLAKEIQLPYPPTVLENCIATFHSRLILQTQSMGIDTRKFELLDKDRRFSRKFAEYMPWITSGLHHEQFRLLNLAYQDAYHQYPNFRERLHELIELLLDQHHWQSTVNDDNQQSLKIKMANQRDPALRQKIKFVLQEHGLWPESLNSPEDAGFQAGGYFIGASGQLTDGRLVFFDEMILQQSLIDTNDQTQYLPTLAGLEVRVQLISRCCFKPSVFISSREQLLLLQHQLSQPEFNPYTNRRWSERWHRNAATPLEAPGFSFRLSGDRSSLSIAEQLYSIASWMQCLSLDPMQEIHDRSLSKTEQLVLKLVPEFCNSFQKILHERNISTFHNHFAQFSSDKNLVNNVAWSQHLLIDEFQDIAPEIVYWIQNLQKHHAGKSSVMAIGDDWQSIYAWRGSSPQFLLNFDHYFVASGLEPPCTTLTLSENFRSINAIVQDAAKAISLVKQCSQRQIISRLTTSPADHGLAHWNLAAQALRGQFHSTVVQIIDFELSLLKSLSEPKVLILVLARKREDLNKIDALLPLNIRTRVGLHTLHDGKGLQAPVAIILDDCTWDARFPLREVLYRNAGMLISYQQTMQDEAHRLAYVGMTRAMRRLLWMTRDNTPDRNGIVRHFQAWGIPERTFPMLTSPAQSKHFLSNP